MLIHSIQNQNLCMHLKTVPGNVVWNDIKEYVENEIYKITVIPIRFYDNYY